MFELISREREQERKKWKWSSIHSNSDKEFRRQRWLRSSSSSTRLSWSNYKKRRKSESFNSNVDIERPTVLSGEQRVQHSVRPSVLRVKKTTVMFVLFLRTIPRWPRTEHRKILSLLIYSAHPNREMKLLLWGFLLTNWSCWWKRKLWSSDRTDLLESMNKEWSRTAKISSWIERHDDEGNYSSTHKLFISAREINKRTWQTRQTYIDNLLTSFLPEMTPSWCTTKRFSRHLHHLSHSLEYISRSSPLWSRSEWLLPGPSSVGRVSFVDGVHRLHRNWPHFLCRSSPRRDRRSMLSNPQPIWHWSHTGELPEENLCRNSDVNAAVRFPFELTDWWTIPTNVVHGWPKWNPPRECRCRWRSCTGSEGVTFFTSGWVSWGLSQICSQLGHLCRRLRYRHMILCRIEAKGVMPIPAAINTACSASNMCCEGAP